MKSILTGDIEEEYVYEKLRELKGLKEIRTTDLIGNYLIYFILLVNKIIEKNEQVKACAELKEEKEKNKLIKENIDKIKEKLKQSKNATILKKEVVISYNPDEKGSTVYSIEKKVHEKKSLNEIKKKNESYDTISDVEKNIHTKANNDTTNISTHDDRNNVNKKVKKCNFSTLCYDLTCGFHICISLLINNLKENKDIERKVVPQKRQDETFNFLEGDRNNSGDGKYLSGKTNLNNDNLRRDKCWGNPSQKECRHFELNLIYIALCFYHMYLINNENTNNLYVSLFLYLLSFPHFKNKEISHYICINEKVYVKYDISVSRFLFLICKTIGLICKRKRDIYSCLFFLTYSFLFLKCAHTKWDNYNEENEEKILKAKEKNTYNTYQELINIFQHLNQIFLEFNFSTVSTFLVLKSIDLHSLLLKSDIEEVKVEALAEKEAITNIHQHTLPRNQFVYVNNEGAENYSLHDHCHYYYCYYYHYCYYYYHYYYYYYFHFPDNQSSDDVLKRGKRSDAWLEDKLKKIMETTSSLFNNINECSYIFLDLHMLCVYEHLLLFSFYMIKDVHKLFNQLKKEKEKNHLKQYKYMIYRSLLEIYIIYLKYNYLNYAKRGGNYISSDTYANVCKIYISIDKTKQKIFSLLQKDCENCTIEKNFHRMEQKKNELVKKKKKNETTSCDENEEFVNRENFHRNKICIRDNKIVLENEDAESISCLQNIISVNADNVKSVPNGEPMHTFFQETTPLRLNDEIFSLVGDNNIIYKFIYEQIIRDNNFNFYKDEMVEVEEEEKKKKMDDDEGEEKLSHNSFAISGTHEKMSFSIFLRENMKQINDVMAEIFILIKEEISLRYEFPDTVSTIMTSVNTPPVVNIKIEKVHAEEFFQIFQFNRINLPHMKLDVSNVFNAEYNNLAINKLKKVYTCFSKDRNYREYEQLLQSSLKNSKSEERTACNNNSDYIHYLCYNFGETQFLFKKVKKYKKKSLEHFSLLNETTLHLDILLNSSESYFYYNFFTKSFDECMKNCMHMLRSISYPLAHITHKQYLSYKRELSLKCALLVKDIFICKKYNTLIDNIYVNEINKNKNLNFDDNISGALTCEQKKLILEIIKYYFLFLNTYEIEKETSTSSILFENEEEKNSYFDIYFYVCKTLSTVDDKMFISQALQHYQRLLNYATKNKMYNDDGYNQYMQNVCTKSIYVLRSRLLEFS
ncbi:hypothetical protein, conserved [Plasmodium gonderi]|uniref:Uncharacterized protein n=1 Tax=Plasmodium gonderi TaxID=77519 RepID=A0A1Y1JPF9_PLAGO|nr:hypothetical protein, conserved [Plasmodium gonderi]GAW82293.1 hypothetical protein, conserved [Plasmodium gonderi]